MELIKTSLHGLEQMIKQHRNNASSTSDDDPNKYLDSKLNPDEYAPYYGCPTCGANWKEEGAVFEYGHAEGGMSGKVDADGDFIQPPVAFKSQGYGHIEDELRAFGTWGPLQFLLAPFPNNLHWNDVVADYLAQRRKEGAVV